MSEQDFNIEEVFESAVAIVKNLPREGPIRPSDELKLKLYAYYKQATYGPNDTPKPKFYQFVEYYKWDAWLKIADMSKEDAMSNYITKLKQIMESIPKEKTSDEDKERYEQVLGKKFYDYWFNKWEQKSGLQELAVGSRQTSGLASSSTSSVKRHTGQQDASGLRNNDTQSNSSDGSSVSMLEETQAPEGDGYKTPTSLDQFSIAGGPMNDQFALAVLRLQTSLDETVERLNKLEIHVKQSLDGFSHSGDQTYPKQLGVRATPSRGQKASAACGSNTSCRIFKFLRQLDSVHWFYLSYPIVVYFFLKAFEKKSRRKNLSS